MFAELSDISMEWVEEVWSALQTAAAVGVAMGCRKLVLRLKALSSQNIIYILLRPSNIPGRGKQNPQ